MGCGTSKASNVVVPVSNTQTNTATLPKATNETPSVNHEPVEAGSNNITEAHLHQSLHKNSDFDIQGGAITTNQQQPSTLDDGEISPIKNTQSSDKESSDVRKGDVNSVTGEPSNETENPLDDSLLRNGQKIDTNIADGEKSYASHVNGSKQLVCHVTAESVVTAEHENICELVNVTNTQENDDQTREPVNAKGEKKNLQTGSEDENTGSKTTQIDERFKSENKTVENSQDKITDTTFLDQERQRKLNVALRFACRALPWEHVRDQASAGVTSLNISRSLMTRDFTFGDLVRRLVSLTELDLSNNLVGPQGFRVVCLGVAKNKTLTSLNLSNNLSDTDSSKALGIMLSRNDRLEFLDVSGNDLGKDYFSRCVGPALLSNKTLKTLRCCSCGATDMTAIMDTLASQPGNRTLVELDVSNNQLGAGFGKQIGNVLKTPDCSLRSLDIHGTNLGEDDMDELLDGIQKNTSLVEINAGGHNARSLSFVIEFVYSSIIHPSLKQLTLDNTKPSEIDQWQRKAAVQVSQPSSLTSLSLGGCSLTDDVVEAVAMATEGLLTSLSHVSLSGNSALTVKSLGSVCKMIKKAESSEALLSSLDFSLNEADGILPFLASNSFLTNLKSLNLRKAKISPTELAEMHKYLSTNPAENSCLMMTSLNLEQIKLSGTNFLQSMLGLSEDFQPMMHCALTSLSLNGCSLNDKDVKPLMVSIGKGLNTGHISLSSNRLTDTSVDWLVDSLVEPCGSLCHLDMSNNKIRNSGAEKLARILHDGKLPKLSTLLLSNNSIGASGIISLVSRVTPNGTLHSLNLKDQQQPVGEEDMDKILETIALSCDISLNDDKTSSKKYLDFSTSTFVSLTGLGGEPGDNGPLLDSIAIQTDFSRKHKRTLSLQDALSLSAALNNSDDGGDPFMSQEEWGLVTSADKDAPAWLKVSDHRRCAVYISNLPLTVTREKLDSLLENEADCNLKEVFLMKDPILRKPNGLAWALFNDEESVQRTIEFYHSGQAQVYGRPIVISPINVSIAEDQGKVTDDEARKEMAARDDLRRAEESANAAIVQAKFEESSARHEYAAQHPAYADGRVW